MILSKEQLTKRPSQWATEDVPVPEFSGDIRIQQWSGDDHDAFGKAVANFKFDGAMYAAAIAVSAIDQNGERLFNLNGDVEIIASTWPQVALKRTYEHIAKLNKLRDKDFEDVAKN